MLAVCYFWFSTEFLTKLLNEIINTFIGIFMYYSFINNSEISMDTDATL